MRLPARVPSDPGSKPTRDATPGWRADPARATCRNRRAPYLSVPAISVFGPNKICARLHMVSCWTNDERGALTLRAQLPLASVVRWSPLLSIAPPRSETNEGTQDE